jgi:hypothetical protein
MHKAYKEMIPLVGSDLNNITLQYSNKNFGRYCPKSLPDSSH